MREQIDFSLSTEFRNFMAGLERIETAQSIIHGIFIDFHPIWRRLVDFERATGLDFYWPWLRDIDCLLAESMVSGPYDPGRSSAVWNDICEHANKKPTPFITKIYILPTTRATLGMRRAIEAYAREQPFFAAVIDAPMPVLAANVEGGAEISASGAGTLGGFLKDQTGKSWGVTCGHVAQNIGGNVSLDDVGGARVANAGTVRFSNFAQLVPQPQAGVCNQYVNTDHLAVDAALFEISAGHTVLGTVKSVGQVDTIYDRTQLNSGNIVAMRGAVSSRRVDYTIGGYGVTCKTQLSAGKAFYCFSHLFEFYAPGNSPSWTPGRVAQALVPRPLQGDSGAWLCFNYSGNRYAYFGNMISVRGAVGIATFADALRTWADDECGLQLTPL